jgi:hypothetical protein
MNKLKHCLWDTCSVINVICMEIDDKIYHVNIFGKHRMPDKVFQELISQDRHKIEKSEYYLSDGNYGKIPKDKAKLFFIKIKQPSSGFEIPNNTTDTKALKRTAEMGLNEEDGEYWVIANAISTRPDPYVITDDIKAINKIGMVENSLAILTLPHLICLLIQGGLLRKDVFTEMFNKIYGNYYHKITNKNVKITLDIVFNKMQKTHETTYQTTSSDLHYFRLGSFPNESTLQNSDNNKIFMS